MGNSTKKYNVVIVHENSILANEYKNALQSAEEQPYIVHIVNNEPETYLKIMEVTPELLISSYKSANIDASRLIKSLVNYESENRPGVLLVGEHLEEKQLRQIMLMGTLDYLEEPIPVNKFRIKVKNAIATFLFKRNKNKTETVEEAAHKEEFNSLVEQIKQEHTTIKKQEPEKEEKTEEETKNSEEFFDKSAGIVKLDNGDWLKIPDSKKNINILVPKSKIFNNCFAWFEGDYKPIYDERKQGWIFNTDLQPQILKKASALPAEILKYLIDNNLINPDEFETKTDAYEIEKETETNSKWLTARNRIGKIKKLEWIVDPKDIKRFKNSSLFLAKGPMQEQGKWNKTDMLNKWEWIWTEEILKEFPLLKESRLFFIGAEPKWIKGEWEEGRWIMGGQNPHFYAETKDNKISDIINFNDQTKKEK